MNLSLALKQFGTQIVSTSPSPSEANQHVLTAKILYHLINNANVRTEQLISARDELDAAVGWEPVVTKPGAKYQGKWIARVAKYLKTEFSYTLPAELRTSLGNLYSSLAGSTRTVKVQISHDFAWPSGMFGDYNSCYWGGYLACRRAMQDCERAWSIRLYSQDDTPLGRAWLVQDYNYPDHAAYIFNVYTVSGEQNFSLHSVGELIASKIEAAKVRDGNNSDVRWYPDTNDDDYDGEFCTEFYLNDDPTVILLPRKVNTLEVYELPNYLCFGVPGTKRNHWICPICLSTYIGSANVADKNTVHGGRICIKCAKQYSFTECYRCGKEIAEGCDYSNGYCKDCYRYR